MGTINKIGIEVRVTKPVRKTFRIETDNENRAINLAIDTIQRRYPAVDISQIKYRTSEFQYAVLDW